MATNVLNLSYPQYADEQKYLAFSPGAGSLFYYTLDLIVEDHNKSHMKDRCVLCEPMKLMHQHRDVVIQELICAMVAFFFEDYSDYRDEVRSSVVDKLLHQQPDADFSQLKEGIEDLILDQLREDVQDFLDDIESHLNRYVQADLPAKRKGEIMKQVLHRLQKTWMNI